MAAFILPLIAGLLSAGGAVATNISNRKQAREQMAFQERMSSTAAQRSVQDYERAGLNPGLAYERSASSPGGASATMEDAIGKGLSSAQAAHALRQQMQLEKLEVQERIALMRGQQEQARTQSALTWAQTVSERINQSFGVTQQPHMDRLNAATALLRMHEANLTQLAIPGMKNTADFERRIGELKGWMGSARTLSEILKNFKR